jgi:hypothetical protein
MWLRPATPRGSPEPSHAATGCDVSREFTKLRDSRRIKLFFFMTLIYDIDRLQPLGHQALAT